MNQVKQMVKQDAIEAGYRIASRQMTKGIKAGIVSLMTDKGMDGGKIEAIKELLETQLGDAIVATLLGYSLTHIPQLQDDKRVQKLAEEFRVSGMANAGDMVIDTALQYLLPAINETMSLLPAIETEEKVRICSDSSEDCEEDEEESEKKQATV